MARLLRRAGEASHTNWQVAMAAVSQTAQHPELAGVAALLRHFDDDGRLRKSAVLPRHAPALAALRHIYGAATDAGDCWRLTYAPQWLRAADLPMAVEIVDETPSTQALLRDGAAPRVLFAEHQTAGLGRRGRGWLGLPADAIALSVALPAPATIAGLSVALAVALATALSDDLFFKWPNDLVDKQGRKIAGLLTQMRGGQILAGAGINWRLTATLRARIAAMGGAAAGALARLPNKVGSRAACAATCATTLTATINSYAGFSPYQTLAAKAHIAQAGDALRVAGAPAIFAGFAEDGALLTRGQDGGAPTRHVNADTEATHVARH